MATQDLSKAIQLILDPPGVYETPPRGWNSAERAILKSAAGSFGMSSDQFKSAVLAREITASTTPTTTPATPTTPTPTTKPATTLTKEELLTAITPFPRYVTDPTAKPPAAVPTVPTGDSVDQTEYNDYLAFLKLPAGKYFPNLTFDQYMARRDEVYTWIERGYTELQERKFAEYKRYASAYGTPDDWYPLSIDDFATNYDQALKQLDTWLGEAGVAVTEREAYEEYALSPEERARRDEEAYAESRYAAEERYREQPMYSETFAGWVKGQGGISEALRGYVESEYPSLRAEYEATLPRQTGFATREEARAEVAKREKGWAGWLQSELPEVRQDYYMQRPYARGERYADYSPTLRTANW